MSNIQVRQNEPQLAMTTPSPAPWEPRLIARMLGWDPFREMAPFFTEERMGFQPAIEVKETEEGYLFKVDVPGVKAAELDVSISANVLTIRGTREAEPAQAGATYYAYERAYGSFTRSFSLPGGANEAAIRADLSDGVLTVLVPKKPESTPTRIAIAAAAEPRQE